MQKSLASKLVWIGGGLAGIAAVAGAAAMLDDRSGPTHSDELVIDLEAQLQGATDPEMRASLEEKLRIALETQAQEREANAADPDPAALKEKQDRLAADTAASEHPPIFRERTAAGDGFIVEEGRPQVHSSLFVAENDWFIDLDSTTREVVWAGRAGDDPTQGTILIIRERPEGHKIEGLFPTPTQNGAVRVASADGRVVTLSAEDGTVFRFDVSARKYI